MVCCRRTRRSFSTPITLIFAALVILNNYLAICERHNSIPWFRRQYLGNSGVAATPKVCDHDDVMTPTFGDSNEFFSCFERTVFGRNSRHPDQDLRVNALINKYGYNLVTYNVTTEDGYILTIFRISGSPKSPKKEGKPKPVVIMLHGMATAADTWVLQNDAEKNLAFMLANAGYDVWLTNSRGTDFSQRHMTMNANIDISYWNFSIHEIGVYDFPAFLKLVRAETGNDKVLLVCHSMGCATHSIALAERPELNDAIQASILLAPALFVGHTRSPLRMLLPYVMEVGPYAQSILNLAAGGRFEGGTPLMNLIQSRFCTPAALRCGFCESILFFLYGYDASQINSTNVPNIMSKFSNTMSFKTLLHLGQNFKSCQFRKYDYGKRENFRTFGQLVPPSYNLSNIRIPTYIYYADADNLVPPVDAMATRDAFPPETVKGFTKVPWKLFNHLDFMVGENADDLVYNGILNIFNNYTRINSS